MAGILYGIGVGPGDPELLTMKAARLLRACPVIGVPSKSAASSTAFRIAVQAVPEISDKPVVAVHVPMTKDAEKLDAAYDEGCGRLAAELRAGRDVAFLNLGDPTLYGTYMVIHRKVRALGFEAVLVSGVPSVCAVAAALNEPLGERSEAIHILPASYPLDHLTELAGTKVLMKSAGELAAVKQRLLELEAQGVCRAAAVTNCGMESQRVFPDTASIDESAGYFTTILVRDERGRRQ